MLDMPEKGLSESMCKTLESALLSYTSGILQGEHLLGTLNAFKACICLCPIEDQEYLKTYHKEHSQIIQAAINNPKEFK